jgi:MerR family mercuric resistance operon transcriptional regulator
MMTIGGLARHAGVGVETVRYYLRRGLLDTPAPAGGVRRYADADLRRLHFIRSAQAAGFTLDQIGELLRLDAGEDRVRARALANERIVALDKKIAELVAARSILERLATECGTTTSGPCPIIASFECGAIARETSRSGG